MNKPNPYFDPSDLHPEAAKSIDQAGGALLDAAVIEEIEQRPSAPFPSRRPSAATITDGDIIGEPSLSWTDWSGRTVGRYFSRDRKQIALRDDGYAQLRKLVEKVLKTKPYAKHLSDKLAEEEVFNWWKAGMRGELSQSLTTHLSSVAERVVKKHQVIVPITAIEIERPFRLGDVLVSPFDQSLLDNFAASHLAANPDRSTAIQEHRAKLKSELGHLTVVSVNTVGDNYLAEDRALEVAFNMASLLRFMSPPAPSWNVWFDCSPKGCEHVRQATRIKVEDGAIISLSQGLIDQGMFHWQLPHSTLDQLMQSGFENCGVFFEEGPLTNFQECVKKSLISYAQGIKSHDVNNKLIYAMSALEQLLLRDDNEPIQASVSDRMAFLLARVPSERMDIASNFKRAYGLRSRQIHHLSSVTDEGILSKYFINAYSVIFRAVQLMSSIKEKNDFITKIDEIKFGNL